MAAKVYRPVKKVERPRPLRQVGSEVSTANNTNNVNINNITTNNNNFVNINNNNSNNGYSSQVDSPRITPEELLGLMEQVEGHLTNQVLVDQVEENIGKIHGQLPGLGPEMERLFPDHLEHYFTTYRQEVRDFAHVSPHALLQLLEMIELRAGRWCHNPDTDNFYLHYLEQGSLQQQQQQASSHQTSPLNPTPSTSPTATSQPSPTGDVLQSSGKYPKPTKIPGKNYFKDEVVIRNADSGKVTSGAKDRLVQITGNNEDSIGNAKLLIEDTIRRNASPDRVSTERGRGPQLVELLQDKPLEPPAGGSGGGSRLMHSLSMGDASRLCAPSDTLMVGGHALQVSCSSPALVEEAMAVLEAHFSAHQPRWMSGAGDGADTNCFVKCISKAETSLNNCFESWKKEPPVIIHTRDFLLQCSQSPLAVRPPIDWPLIKANHPTIVRNPPGRFDPHIFLTRPRKSHSSPRSHEI